MDANRAQAMKREIAEIRARGEAAIQGLSEIEGMSSGATPRKAQLVHLATILVELSKLFSLMTSLVSVCANQVADTEDDGEDA